MSTETVKAMIVGHRTGETARRLGVTSQTIRNWIRRHELEAITTSDGQQIITDDAIEKKLEELSAT